MLIGSFSSLEDLQHNHLNGVQPTKETEWWKKSIALTETLQPVRTCCTLTISRIFQQLCQINSCLCLCYVCCVARQSANILMLIVLTDYWIDVRISVRVSVDNEGKQHANKCRWKNDHTHTHSIAPLSISLSICFSLYVSSVLLPSCCSFSACWTWRARTATCLEVTKTYKENCSSILTSTLKPGLNSLKGFFTVIRSLCTYTVAGH